MRAYSDQRTTQQLAKRGPPRRGRSEKPAGVVARLVRATSPPCGALLSSGLFRTITVLQSNVISLSGRTFTGLIECGVIAISR
jgi:hypothetical protein